MIATGKQVGGLISVPDPSHGEGSEHVPTFKVSTMLHQWWYHHHYWPASNISNSWVINTV